MTIFSIVSKFKSYAVLSETIIDDRCFVGLFYIFRNYFFKLKHWTEDLTVSLWARHHSNSHHIWQKIQIILWIQFEKILRAEEIDENSVFLNFLLIHYRPGSLWNSLWNFFFKTSGCVCISGWHERQVFWSYRNIVRHSKYATNKERTNKNESVSSVLIQLRTHQN